jgi:hypothetical protein
MKYMLLIYADESRGHVTPEVYAEFEHFSGALRSDGAFVSAHELAPTAEATRLTAHNGHTATTDGPFAETKEALAGYFLIECADLDAALGYAARIPAAAFGTIEVRPVREA